ncbi:MFS transporter [Acinetobacter sp. SWAC57]|uniref:MFS transporter n=1 Tax=Acinetobacter sp. SWAC57 TaxID=2293834 RepID=UPI000E5A1ECE|nr:MFS transporter [Acinetobacter sp. SWAC57]RGD93702.1 MFS transporter [Acinetobacter sp. SWAC57]
MTPAQQSVEIEQQPAYWSGVFAMTLCVFALIASEFMPVSLLTPIAKDLSVTEGLAGYGIAISGAFAVITSLSISRLAGSINRKALLLALTALMAVSGAVVALAPNYWVYMFGRALIGVVVGGFWSMSAATAIRLVPTAQVPRALAIFNSGNALATVVAPPLGSYLGAMIGWRGAFFCLVPIAILAFIWQWISLPSLKNQTSASNSSDGIFKLLNHRIVLIGMLATGLLFMGQFSLYTYIRPFLETVTKLNLSTLSFTLFVIGIMGFVGTVSISFVLKRHFYGTLIAIPLLMAAIALTLIGFGTWSVLVIVMLGFWGLIGTAAPVGWWSWIAQNFPNNAEAGGGLFVAIVQLCIALGSTVGGLLFDYSGYQMTFAVSAILLIISAALTLWVSRLTI